MRSAWLAAILVVAPLWAQTSPVRDQSREPQSTPPAGTASLTGIVLVSINRQPSPVRRARVTLRNEGGAIHTTDTDTQGQFRFAQLSGGTYKVIVDKPGFVPMGREPVIELKDRQATKVTAVMQRGAAIEGRLVNASGEPAMGLTVSAVRLGFGPYGKKVVAHRQTTTDDLGRFRLHTLLPGEYYIEAAPDPLRMLGSAPAPGQISARRTYYPGTARLNEAQVVALAAEQQLDNVTFSMTDAALTLVTATVHTASGQAPVMFSVRVQRVGAPPGEVRCVLLQGGPGAFQCPNVPPGDFWFLVAARPAPDAGVEFAATRTTIEGRDLDLAVTTAPGASITGRVEVEGGVPLPPNVQSAALETEFERPGPSPTASTSGTPPVPVGADGGFTFQRHRSALFDSAGCRRMGGEERGSTRSISPTPTAFVANSARSCAWSSAHTDRSRRRNRRRRKPRPARVVASTMPAIGGRARDSSAAWKSARPDGTSSRASWRASTASLLSICWTTAPGRIRMCSDDFGRYRRRW
jgi:hypothetical protein